MRLTIRKLPCVKEQFCCVHVNFKNISKSKKINKKSKMLHESDHLIMIYTLHHTLHQSEREQMFKYSTKSFRKYFCLILYRTNLDGTCEIPRLCQYDKALGAQFSS